MIDPVQRRGVGMPEPSNEKSAAGPDVAETIDAIFRNGSITTVGIILGFSLGFLSQWASNPIAWSKVDIAAAAPIILGIVLQGKALADLLKVESLIAHNYERSRKVFLVGLALVAAGVAVAILLDILGLGPRTLAP
jgi:hypothetical protein